MLYIHTAPWKFRALAPWKREERPSLSGLQGWHSTDSWPLTWAWQPAPHCSETWREPQGQAAPHVTQRCWRVSRVFAPLSMSSLQIHIPYLGLSASEPPETHFLARISGVKGVGFYWSRDRENAIL